MAGEDDNMGSGTGLYPHVTRQLKRIQGRISESNSICRANKESLLNFLTKLQADGTSESQQLSYMTRLMPIAKLMGSTGFRDVTKKQMEEIFAKWRSSYDKGYKQSSINKAIECIKGFFRWVYNLSSEDSSPECVRWMRRENQINDIRAEDLWTEEDMTKVMNATRSELYKVMISVAYESGLRPGELRSLRIGDIKFMGDIVRIYCRGKTMRKRGERVVPLIRCNSMLRRWVYNHPLKSDPAAWLWASGREPLPICHK